MVPEGRIVRSIKELEKALQCVSPGGGAARRKMAFGSWKKPKRMVVRANRPCERATLGSPFGPGEKPEEAGWKG